MKQAIKPTKKNVAISFVLILLGMSLWALFDTIKDDNPKRLYNNRYFKQIPMNEIGTTGLYKRNNAYKFDTLQTQAHFIYPVANNLVKEDNIISTYTGISKAYGLIKYIPQQYVCWERRYKTKRDYFGDPYEVPYYETVSYWQEEPVYSWYNFKYNLYILDIPEEFKTISNEKLLSDTINKILATTGHDVLAYARKTRNEAWGYDSNEYLPNLSVSFCVKGYPKGIKVHTIYNNEACNNIFFVHNKLYLLEVKSPYYKVVNSKKIIASLAAYDWNKAINEYDTFVKVKYYGLNIVITLLSIGLVFAYLASIRKEQRLNAVVANRLGGISFFFVLVNIVWVALQSYVAFIGKYSVIGTWSTHMLLLMVSLLIIIITTIYLFSKVKEQYRFDFLLNGTIATKLGTITADNEYHAIISLVVYPCVICCMVPYGVVGLAVYVVPIIIIAAFVMGAQKLFLWIGGSSSDKATISAPDIFKDYYLMLDLPRTATTDDVYVAYNRVEAQNKAKGNKRFTNQELQEAYMVLSSEKRLRPLYDKEYELYEATDDFASFRITNAALLRDLTVMRQAGKTLQRHSVNIVYVALIVLVVLYIATYFVAYNGNTTKSKPAKIERKNHVGYDELYESGIEGAGIEGAGIEGAGIDD